LSHCQVPGLLGDPRRVRVPGHAHDVYAPRPDLDLEQHVQGPEPGRLHGEEVHGQDPPGLRPEELAPRGTGPSWSRRKTSSPEDRADRGGPDPDPELAELALDPDAPPPGVLPAEPNDEVPDLGIQRRATE